MSFGTIIAPATYYVDLMSHSPLQAVRFAQILQGKEASKHKRNV